MRPDIAPPNLPNASVNANINPNIFTRQQDTLKKAAGQVGYALAHIGYLQSGKPNCPPGSECYDRNKDHWRDEINGAVRKLERYLKRLKGTAKENLEKTIEQIKNDAGI